MRAIVYHGFPANEGSETDGTTEERTGDTTAETGRERVILS